MDWLGFNPNNPNTRNNCLLMEPILIKDFEDNVDKSQEKIHRFNNTIESIRQNSLECEIDLQMVRFFENLEIKDEDKNMKDNNNYQLVIVDDYLKNIWMKTNTLIIGTNYSQNNITFWSQFDNNYVAIGMDNDKNNYQSRFQEDWCKQGFWNITSELPHKNIEHIFINRYWLLKICFAKQFENFIIFINNFTTFGSKLYITSSDFNSYLKHHDMYLKIKELGLEQYIYFVNILNFYGWEIINNIVYIENILPNIKGDIFDRDLWYIFQRIK